MEGSLYYHFWMFFKIKSLKRRRGEEEKVEVRRPIQKQVLDDPLGFAHSLNQAVREEKDNRTSRLSNRTNGSAVD